MRSIEQLLFFLFPTSMISSKNHLVEYYNQEEKVFRNTMFYILPFVALTYIGHYFFFDIPMNLQPKSLWLNFRFSFAGTALLLTLYYAYFSKYKIISTKLPALIFCFALCYFQARAILWYDQVPYLYSFIFVLLTSFSLRLTPSQTFVYAAVAIQLKIGNYIEFGIEPALLYTASFVTIFFSIILSSFKYFQIKVFISNLKLIEEQKTRIEHNIAFTHTLKSFLPKKISKQMDHLIANNGLTIHQAVDEVLRPINKKITCLSCDIRGYTEKSKTNSRFIRDSVIPLTKNESKIVEDHNGIPRKIGDLLFCYFDSESLLDNVKNVLLTGINICMQENDHNKFLEDSSLIRKQIMISAGEAYVGNIGGTESSIEITAMGTPVNFLNRLEDVVKSEHFINEIPKDHIIISKEVYEILVSFGFNLNTKRYNIDHNKVSIKDFKEVDCFYSLKADLSSYNEIQKLEIYKVINNRGLTA